MPRTYTYHTLDVFTSTPFKGNQLGIVTIPSSNPLTQSEKQSIAIEFNYSETIFIHLPTSPQPPTEPPHIKVDIFTPESELPFAGHPTIGAVHHILTHIHPNSSTVIVELKAGPVLGKLDRKTGYASASIPQNFHRHAKQISWRDDVLTAQPGLHNDDEEGREPAGQHVLVSIVPGMNFALVDLSSTPELLGKVKVTPKDVVDGTGLDEGWPATLVGSLFYVRKPDTGDGVVRADQRVIVIGLEDPATGSASAAFTAYLALEMGGEGAVHRFELVQGELMGRRSVIGVEVTLDSSGKKVEKIVLLGQCKAVMKGELKI